MRCPNDSTALIVVERQGFDIHSCPICGGVWLERGELDEIVNRSMAATPQAAQDPSVDFDHFDDDTGSDRPRRRRDRYDDVDEAYERPRKKKRRRARDMVEDMMDF